MQETQVWSLDWEDPTCSRPTKLMGHNYWSLRSGAREPQLQEAMCPRACALQPEKLLQWEARAPQLESSPHSPQLERACTQQWRPRAAKKLKKSDTRKQAYAETRSQGGWWHPIRSKRLHNTPHTPCGNPQSLWHSCNNTAPLAAERLDWRCPAGFKV